VSACRSRVAGRVLDSLRFSFFLSRRPRHLNTPLNNLVSLLGGRVVSIATLPVMVSRLGWGSRFKSDSRFNDAGSLIKPVRDPWNLAGWVTPRQPRSRCEDLPSLTLTNYASGGSAWIYPIPFDLGISAGLF